jgi:antitoxin component of MazEF toxin-antitoxin module
MSAVKLQKIGNSFGFRISRPELEAAGFDENGDYELVAEKGVIMIVRKRAHASKWIFKDTALNAEDTQWLESKLESGNKKR